MAEYLTVVEVMAIYALLTEEFGGAEGVRDLGALEAAVFRPQTGYYEDAIAGGGSLGEPGPEITRFSTTTSARPSPLPMCIFG